MLSLVALDKLPLFVVQAIIAASLVVVVVLARFVLGTRMRPIDRVAVVVVVGALVLVSLAGGEQPAVAPPRRVRRDHDRRVRRARRAHGRVLPVRAAGRARA